MSNGIIEQMQAEIESLKNRVGVLENIREAGEVSLPVCTTLEERLWNPQQDRDEIIEKAKLDVAYLKSKLKDRYALHLVYENGHLGVSFIVNREKRTIVALLDGLYVSIGRKLKGIAKCAPDDCFNVHLGKAIALRRALGLEVPFEYLHVPQPTEVQVGDIVELRWVNRADPEPEYWTVAKVDGDRVRFTDGSYDELSVILAKGDDELRYCIYDDSREEVPE